MGVITVIGIVSIAIGFLCVGGAYYSFQRGSNRRVPLVLGLCALLCLTVIPVICAVFYAATNHGY